MPPDPPLYPPDPRRVEQLFNEALALASPADRAAFLASECAGDAALLQRVQILLDSATQAGTSFLPTDQTLTLDPVPLLERPGISIGPYKLLQQIGEGGFGVVFMAEQERPIRRRVALKVIKLGMDTRQIVARFEAERQALAMMDHPNIARVFDAGSTQTGRPYFVMELVNGVSLTSYCNENKLSTEERLKLIIQVCGAVQHAHQKGIIHRDLKPSNVLVTMHDDKPVPKVIDFGIAKATQARLTDKTLFTEFRQMIGTPAYMSPEQVQLSGLDIDTRSDIYSLGVLLYELLTGVTPFDRELKEAVYAEIQRVIRQVEPLKPSTRLASLQSDTQSTVAGQRSSDPRRLTRTIRGDLDWIVMRCLEKDRTRRYDTASGLARDIQRFLDCEAVEATPPSASYRLRKFASRNKAGLLVVAIIVAVILVGSAASAWEAIRASRAETLAKASEQKAVQERDAKELMRRDAETSARQAQEVSQFLIRAFSSPSPERQGRSITMAEVLDRSVHDLKDRFADDPRTKSLLLESIAEAYLGMGLYRESIPLLEESLKLRSQSMGPEHSETAILTASLATAYAVTGRLSESLPLLERAVPLMKASLGKDNPKTLQAMLNLAETYRRLGRLPEALPLLEETLKIQEAKLGPDHSDTLLSRNNIAVIYADMGRESEALAIYEETLRRFKATLGNDHPRTLLAMENVASSYWRAGRYDDGQRLYEEILQRRQKVLGPDHPDTITTMFNMGLGYMNQNQLDKSTPLLEEALRLRQLKLGIDHPQTLLALHNLAWDYWLSGERTKALPLMENALKSRRTVLGEDHQQTLKSAYALGTFYCGSGGEDAGITLLQETHRRQSAKLGADHSDTLATLNALMEEFRKSGRSADALKYLDELCLSQPTVSRVWSLRGAFRAQAGQLHPAAMDFAQAVELASDSRSYNSPRKLICRELAESSDVLAEVAKLRPDDSTLWIGRAQLHLLRGDVAAATKDYAHCMNSRPLEDDSIAYAGVLCLTGSSQAYEQYTKDCIARSGEPHDAAAYTLARICTLAPSRVVDSGQVVKWASQAVEERPSAWRLSALALAQYRAGQYDLAIKNGQASNDANLDDAGKSQNWSILAMSRFRLGDTPHALEALESSRKLLQRRPDSSAEASAPTSFESPIATLLVREAETLLSPGTMPATSK